MSMLSLQQYTCDHPAGIDFNIGDYMGNWYMQSQSASLENRVLTKACVISNFHSLDGDSFNIDNQYISLYPGAGPTGLVQGNKEGFCDASGECNIWTPPPPGLKGMPRPNVVRIIDTDYTTYSINYECDDNSGFPRVWILTRSESISQTEYDQIYHRMTSLLPSFDHGSYM